ncbi:hypothetical protein [Flavobacterium sp.]|uniref:hypothetical protein n=1 Tax=Flavobacterium sp. TaxID=239 RepID=UPI00262348CF|nr:hypothetical protein [Flavobacterium sp.]
MAIGIEVSSDSYQNRNVYHFTYQWSIKIGVLSIKISMSLPFDVPCWGKLVPMAIGIDSMNLPLHVSMEY